MIALRTDYLLFETPEGGYRPCCAETVAERLFEPGQIEQDDLKRASSAAVKYFKEVEKREKVSAEDFGIALALALIELGYTVEDPEEHDVDEFKISNN